MDVFPVRISVGNQREYVLSGRMLRIWAASTGSRSLGDLVFFLKLSSEELMGDVLSLSALGLIRMGQEPLAMEGGRDRKEGMERESGGGKRSGQKYGVYRGIKIVDF
jgi:hypothetical protein